MAEFSLNELLSKLAESGFNCTVEGSGVPIIRAVNTLEHATEGDLSFLTNPRYRGLLATTKASAVLVNHSDVGKPSTTLIRCNDPYGAVAAAVVAIHGLRKHPQWGIHPSATICDKASIGSGANIGPGVTIDVDVTIGKNVTLYPGVYLGKGVILGDDVTLFPNVVIYDGCVLGHRVTIHACSVIGEDGLGYAPVNSKWEKIPQVGIVRIEDDVEIGSNCAIDRATLGFTGIGRGSKFSNLIAIGHGTRVGSDCMLVAQVGIAGSVTVGNRVTMAGQTGVAGHLKIGDGVQVGAMSGIHTDIEPGMQILGAPAIPISEARRQIALVRKLPRLNEQVRVLKQEVERLRRQLEGHDCKGAPMARGSDH